jgi:hypothetical protein
MMAEEEKVLEEVQAKKAEQDGITAEVKKEEAEKQAQFVEGSRSLLALAVARAQLKRYFLTGSRDLFDRL